MRKFVYVAKEYETMDDLYFVKNFLESVNPNYDASEWLEGIKEQLEFTGENECSDDYVNVKLNRELQRDGSWKNTYIFEAEGEESERVYSKFEILRESMYGKIAGLKAAQDILMNERSIEHTVFRKINDAIKAEMDKVYKEIEEIEAEQREKYGDLLTTDWEE